MTDDRACHGEHAGTWDHAAEASDGVPHHQIFTEGDTLFAAMLADIDAARRQILLETYIFREDHIGGKFLSALRRAAQRGVSVQMRIDALGSKGLVSPASIRALGDSGVAFNWSRRWHWRHPLRYNRRNHRKLLVVDDRAAYVGGFNIGDENSLTRFGAARWRDTHIRLTGPIVRRAGLLFQDFAGGRRQSGEDWADGTLLMPNYNRACRYGLRSLLHRRFTTARRRIWVTTPYFVPDRRTQRHLIAAARRGVDVKLLLPGKSDVAITRWAARASYYGLLQSGVKIYEYGARVLHAKTVLIDEVWSTIGTANLDYRSFFVNYELNFIARSNRINDELSAIFLNDLKGSVYISATSWSKRRYVSHVAEFIGWVARRWL